MNKFAITQRCAQLERTLDVRLFARREDDDESHAGRTAAVIAGGGAVAAGGALAHRRISDRMGGMRASIPGFAMKSRPGQYASAAGDLAKDGVVAGCAYASAAGPAGRQAARNAKAVGIRTVRKVRRAVSFSARERLLNLAERCEHLNQFGLSMSDHVARHLGGPIGVAITSKNGQKRQALKESAADQAKNIYGGTAIGAAAGALAGTAASAKSATRHGLNGLAKRNMLKEAAKAGRLGRGAGAGAVLGAYGGLLAGSIRGTHGKRQRQIQEKYHA